MGFKAPLLTALKKAVLPESEEVKYTLQLLLLLPPLIHTLSQKVAWQLVKLSHKVTQAKW